MSLRESMCAIEDEAEEAPRVGAARNAAKVRSGLGAARSEVSIASGSEHERNEDGTAPQGGGWNDAQVETVMGNLLRVGVLVAAVVVVAGGALFLLRHGTEPTHYGLFRGEPADLRSVTAIVSDSFSLSGQGLIQLGLLLLVATPIARVVFSVVAFLRERDPTYVVITLLVLGVLAYSLLGGQL